MLSRVVFAPTGDNDDANRNRELVQCGWSRNPQVELKQPIPPLVEWCVRQDFGYGAGYVLVLARSESAVRRRAEPVLRGVYPTSTPFCPVAAFPHAEYRERSRPRDFTAGVRLAEHRLAH